MIDTEGCVHRPGSAAEESTDAEVVKGSLVDPARFGLLYERHAKVLHGYAYRRLGQEAAEDVVAETFMKAFRARRTYDLSHRDARPWFFAIAAREIARHHRVEQARYRLLLRSAVDRAEECHADQVADTASAQMLRRPLIEALTRLTRRERDVLLMIAWADLTYEEVARALELPLGTVRSRLHRARQKIRKYLPDDIAVELT
ncbi:RNA polymerase sigma factor [Micromonospora chalcea]|uniref:RNA polymerase sigma factor n=1 Tax=Micromonospora chalcea TaxID=1874 RepID=UPI0004C3BD4F|nr:MULTISPECIES: RNA polymerase sigma factor [Micromonospora]MCT2278082.1 RNA polymerase sigma factor [Micromonospora chalcea]